MHIEDGIRHESNKKINEDVVLAHGSEFELNGLLNGNVYVS